MNDSVYRLCAIWERQALRYNTLSVITGGPISKRDSEPKRAVLCNRPEKARTSQNKISVSQYTEYSAFPRVHTSHLLLTIYTCVLLRATRSLGVLFATKIAEVYMHEMAM